MIHVQQLFPPKPLPQPPVADKSPIRNSSNYLYTVILCRGGAGVTDFTDNNLQLKREITFAKIKV